MPSKKTKGRRSGRHKPSPEAEVKPDRGPRHLDLRSPARPFHRSSSHRLDRGLKVHWARFHSLNRGGKPPAPSKASSGTNECSHCQAPFVFFHLGISALTTVESWRYGDEWLWVITLPFWCHSISFRNFHLDKCWCINPTYTYRTCVFVTCRRAVVLSTWTVIMWHADKLALLVFKLFAPYLLALLIIFICLDRVVPYLKMIIKLHELQANYIIKSPVWSLIQFFLVCLPLSWNPSTSNRAVRPPLL